MTCVRDWPLLIGNIAVTTTGWEDDTCFLKFKAIPVYHESFR